MSATSAGNASTTDLLTTLKNVVIALNNAADAYLSVNGKTTLTGIAAPTLIKSSGGRVASVSVTVAGSAAGMIYDSSQLQVTNIRPLWIIPQAVASNGEPYDVNLSTAYGIVVVPGTGQTVAVCYS